MRQTAGQDGHRALFNNAAQAWNHAFYWRSLVSAVTGCHLYFAHRVTFLPAELGHTVAAGSVLAVHPEEADGAFTRLWQEDYFLRRISVKKATGYEVYCAQRTHLLAEGDGFEPWSPRKTKDAFRGFPV